MRGTRDGLPHRPSPSVAFRDRRRELWSDRRLHGIVHPVADRAWLPCARLRLRRPSKQHAGEGARKNPRRATRTTTESNDFSILSSVELESNTPYNGIMKTTVDIPDREFRELLRLTKAKTKREAIVIAIADFNRRQRMAALVKHSGTFRSLMTNEEIEALEAQEAIGGRRA